MATPDIAAAPASAAASTDRYAAVAIALHWLIAALIVVQLLLGWWMNEWVPDHSPQQAAIEAWHISNGVVILLLVLVRIGVRLAYRPPPLPPMAGWERMLVTFTHSLFYVLLLVVPLTGWAIVSVGAKPIHVWGLPWPHLPGLGFMQAHKDWRHALTSVHVYWLIWLVLINLALHIAGALYHQFGGRETVLWRMGIGRKPAP
jgi:cytochrome b561